METMTCTFSTVEELVAFVAKAEKYDFKVEIADERLVVDGKSLMGAMLIGIGKHVEVRFLPCK